MKKIPFFVLVLVLVGFVAPTAFSNENVLDTTDWDLEVIEVDVLTADAESLPTEIHVNKGVTVRITFISDGSDNVFVLEEFDIESDVLAEGQSQTIEFVADTAGEYEYYWGAAGEDREDGVVGQLIVVERA